MLVNFGGKRLINLYIAAIFLGSAYLVSEDLRQLFFILAWLTAGLSVFINFFKSIKIGEFFDENCLMTLATSGAVYLGNYAEAVCVMILYGIGEYLQECSIEKSTKSINSLMEILPEYANVERFGKVETIKPQDVLIDDILIIKPGERVPVDGIVTFGESTIDTSSITGESVPRNVAAGDGIYSGCININGVIKLRAERSYEDSAVSRIMSLVESAREKKTKTEKFITKFARVYTPIVLLLAILLVAVPCAINMANYSIYGVFEIFKTQLNKALTFMVIACPCAFVISVPLSFFSGIGAASAIGVLIKGENHIETLANVTTAVFDKTGTITNGNYKVSMVLPAAGVDREELIITLLEAERGSNHPIAKAIINAFAPNDSSFLTRAGNVLEIAGHGIWCTAPDNEIIVGNKEFFKEYGIVIADNNFSGTKVFVARNKKYLGCVIIADEVKPAAKITVSKLRDIGINSVMLTGDIRDNALCTVKAVGISEWYSGLVPAEKVHKIEMLSKESKKGKVLYAGDGINDAAVIMSADVGVAMGAIGSHAAIEAADVVVTDDNLIKIYLAIEIAKRTMKAVKQNIALAFGVKVIFLLLGYLGMMSMWFAVFADTGVTLIAILNSLKILRFKNKFD